MRLTSIRPEGPRPVLAHHWPTTKAELRTTTHNCAQSTAVANAWSRPGNDLLSHPEQVAPSAGFEPAHMAPEANALSPELRGRGLPGSASSDDLTAAESQRAVRTSTPSAPARIADQGSLVAIARSGWATMAGVADPLSIVAELLAPVFAEIAGRPDVDPVVRPSDRADAQVNGALPLAKQIGVEPARDRPAGRRLRACSTMCAARSRSPGPGSSTSRSPTRSSPRSSQAVAVDDRLGIAAGRRRRRRSSSTTRRRTWPRRCTSATCARP